LDIVQRAHLAARIDATWPAVDEYHALDRALLCVRLFDHIALPARADARRADVHAILEREWIDASRVRSHGEVGGFSPDFGRFQTSMDGPTYSAVALMARFGVPDGIDVRAVRAYLRSESRAFPIVFESMPYLRATERAALLRLEREVGIPPRTWLETIVGERTLIASLLIVILCVIAIRMAPPVEKRVTRVTLP